MAGVEQAQLHQLVGHHIGDHLCPDLLVGRTAKREVVLDHPLGERFADHRPGILDAEATGDLGNILLGGHRRDAVNHGIGEGDMAGDKVTQLNVLRPGVGTEHLLGNVAVALDVVAAHHRERRDVASAAATQCLGD